MTDYRHRCTTPECPYFSQLTDNLSCGCHRKEAEIMKEQLEQARVRISELLRFNNEFEERARVAERKNKKLIVAFHTAMKVASEARKEWDKAPDGMKAGKLLIALIDPRLHYRQDITDMHAAFSEASS